jgi:hypothetical protein
MAIAISLQFRIQYFIRSRGLSVPRLRPIVARMVSRFPLDPIHPTSILVAPPFCATHFLCQISLKV